MFKYTVLFFLPALALCQLDINLLANNEFNRFDVDNDGQIEANEVQQYFRRFDANHDGRISRQEYQHEVDTHHLQTPSTHQVLTHLFDELDFDNDNFLDQADFDKLLQNADSNNNDLVNHQEFVRYFHQLTGTPFIG